MKNRYKDAMDALPVREDLSARTMKNLTRAGRKRRARRKRVRYITALAALAACLAVVLILPKINLNASMQAPMNAPAPAPVAVPSATAQPAPAAVRDTPVATSDMSYDMAAEAPMIQSMSGAFMDGYPNAEEYSFISENRFLSAFNNPLSTFAADVDTASYANARRMILAGELPPADAVRIEEWINYFHYDYPEPVKNQPFSVTTELSPCPWNPDTRLMKIGLKAKPITTDTVPDSNLVFLIDVSGSMDSSDKLGLVKQAFMLLCESLRAEDRVSVVTYASSDSVLLEGASGENKNEILTAIGDLTAGGSTHGSAGIATAYELAEKYFIKGGNNRVILATDGDLNVGTTGEGELTRLIQEKKQSGVYLSVMGFGSGNLKDNKLEALADNGNGNYSYIDSLIEAKRVLVEEMGATFFTVCKDVKLQVEFNPATVKGYRLIGYENRLMDAEDFADDTKDGGEIGAGHTVTVLYEVALADSKMPIDGVELTYQRADATGSQDFATVNIRYKEPDGDASALMSFIVDKTAVKDSMTDGMKLACAVAEAGMVLTDSKFKGTSSLDGAIALIDSLPDQDDAVKEFAYLLSRMRALKDKN